MDGDGVRSFFSAPEKRDRTPSVLAAVLGAKHLQFQLLDRPVVLRVAGAKGQVVLRGRGRNDGVRRLNAMREGILCNVHSGAMPDVLRERKRSELELGEKLDAIVEQAAKDKKVTIDRVFAVGPVIMMKAVSDMTRSPEIPTIVNLNPIMLDGTGMCGVCRVEVDGQTRFACVDGPEFDGHKVNYDLLVQRLQTYLKEEQQSKERYVQSCKGKCHA